jgi:hypothetical protein
MTVYCKRFHCVTPNTARRSFGNVNALSRQGVGSTEGNSLSDRASADKYCTGVGSESMGPPKGTVERGSGILLGAMLRLK